MKNVSSVDILGSIFLANPKYELVFFDRLPAEQREVLKDLRKDPAFYGILRPLEESGLGVKSVSRDIALLYLTLQQPGRLPEYVRATLGDRCNQEIIRLVLDGVLALEHDGKFVFGPDAAGLVCGSDEELQAASENQGFLERLSFEALRYGQSLRLTDAMALSTRLYAYNRMPLSPYWKRLLPDARAVAEYLCIQDGRTRELLDREWQPVSEFAGSEGWLFWRIRRSVTTPAFGERTRIKCKLYISPRIDHLPQAFPSIIAVLSRTCAHHFKVGKDVSGLLRPDKMVAYFTSYEDLVDASQQLKQELAGCAAHGVPFTAELTDDGLLSMGVDPPAEGQVSPWMVRESWRLWVTNRLAVALIAANSNNGNSLEPWRFALQRLRLEGVDTRSWTPAGTECERISGAENSS